MSDLKRVFENLKKQGNGALIGYVTGGDPEPECTPIIAEALIKGGVDVLELGVPFSDPIADGPAIQAASIRALDAGTTPKMVLEIALEIKEKHSLPIVILTYFNPIFRMGLENFFQLARTCKIDGVVVPDLPIEEAVDFKKAAETYRVDTVFLAAPSTSNERLDKIIAFTSGFLYVVSHFGVTGEKTKIENSTIQLVKRIVQQTKGRIPVAVGFGVSQPEHVKAIINAGADGVIVGSAFVNIIQRNQNDIGRMLEEIQEAVCRLKAATRKVT